MPQLSANQTVTTANPVLPVENQLKAGVYRFRLVVVDNAGKESLPAEIEVTVRDKRVRNPADILRDRIVTGPVVTGPIRVTPTRVTPPPPPAPKPPPPPAPKPPPAVNVTRVTPTRVTPGRVKPTPVIRPKPKPR